jgi:glyoxylase-like metal-dependent hydrolase (beta-lactamase superfamily II)
MSSGHEQADDGLRYPFEIAPGPGGAVEVADGVHWIRMPLPFPPGHINLWLLEDDDGWTIVDSGIKRTEIRDLWEQIFNGVMGGRPAKRMIITHMHPDHLGLAGWLSVRLRVPLWMTRLEYLVGRSLVLDDWDQMPWEILEFFIRAGFSDQELAAIQQSGYGRFKDDMVSPPSAYRPIRDGEIITIGGREWQVVVGRGHSPEQATLYCPELGVLISGDQVLPRITPNVSVFAAEPEANPLQAWFNSLRRYKDLPEDVLVLPSHNDPFYGLHDRVDSIIASHEARLERMLDWCKEPMTAREVSLRLFGDRGLGLQNLLALGEAIAHLHYLRGKGKLIAEDDASKVRRFRAAAV